MTTHRFLAIAFGALLLAEPLVFSQERPEGASPIPNEEAATVPGSSSSAATAPVVVPEIPPGGEAAEESPPSWLSWSLQDGISSDSPLLRPPGKLDFRYRRQFEVNDYNLILWTPVFKGGVGVAAPDGRRASSYYGGYVRPLAAKPEWGDLIVGANGVDLDANDAWELQGEYRFPFGVGFGGGLVERSASDADVAFGKVTFRGELLGWRSILAAQAQEVANEVSPGGYAAVYNDYVMGVGGTDGEQWRATFGFISPQLNDWLRPAGEVLYVDNEIGQLPGPRFLFVNATLLFRGGFLSNPARLGRAMGPQGLEYGNPLGFLRPSWNRRLDVWELGGVLDFRFVRTELPSGAVNAKCEGLVYPLQIIASKTVFDGIFVGGSFTDTNADDTPGVLAGFSGKLAFLQVSVGIEYLTRTDDLLATIGVIDTF